MSPPYKENPFCDRVFEIGTVGDGRMKRHIHPTHADEPDEDQITVGYAATDRDSGREATRTRNERNRGDDS